MADLLLAIDPGNAESAYALIDHASCRPVDFAKVPNDDLLDLLCGEDAWLGSAGAHVAIEMVASYGMPVGADVFETCVWIGRFQQALAGVTPVDLVKRHPVKMHHCHSAAARDSHIAQALKDRFAPGARNHGKGTKAEPGWFYGFAADVWQAYALAVYVADTTPTSPSPQSAPASVSPEEAPEVGAPRPAAATPGGERRPATPPASGTPAQGEGNGVPDPISNGALF